MKTILGILLPLTFLAILASSVWYVPSRVSTLLDLRRRRALTLGYATIVVASLTGMLAAATSANSVAGLLYVAGGFATMVHVYLVLGLLTLHVAQGVRPIEERLQVGLAVIIALATTAAAAVFASDLHVDEHEFSLPNLPEPITVMHVSDVHLGHHRGRDFLERVVTQTNAANPDLVVITGDLIDGNVALDEHTLEPLSKFGAPVYFVTGNHETYIDFDRALSMIADQGVHVLRNEAVKTQGLQIVGLDYMNADDDTFDMHPVGDRTIENELPKIPLNDDEPVILLHHSPVGLEYVKAAGTDLMLAGHTHAGQVFPATLFAPLIFNMNQGRYDFEEEMPVFVSPGAGTFMARMRLGSRNTIHVLRIVPRPS